MKITTIGLDLAKRFFRFTALMRPVRSLSASLCDGRRCCRSNLKADLINPLLNSGMGCLTPYPAATVFFS